MKTRKLQVTLFTKLCLLHFGVEVVKKFWILVVRWRFCKNNWRFGSLYFTYETFEPVPQIIIIATLVSKCFALQKESSSLNVRKVFRKPENYYRFTIYGLLYESRSLAQSSLARFRFLLCCCLPHSVENWLKKSHFTSFYIFKIVPFLNGKVISRVNSVFYFVIFFSINFT